MAKTKKYKFEISEGVFSKSSCHNPGQPYWSAHSSKTFGDYHGFSFPMDTREEAEKVLYDYQDKHNIPDDDIEWVNIEPRKEVEQMELF